MRGNELRPYSKKLREYLKTVKKSDNAGICCGTCKYSKQFLEGDMFICNKSREYDSVVNVLGLCNNWE